MITRKRSAFLVFVLFVAFGPGSRLVGMDPPQQLGNQREKARLRWKFTEGQTSYYSHDYRRTTRQSKSGKTRETANHLLYRYRWQVLFEMEPDFAGIGVTFQRVRHESVTPERTITTDTFAPLAPKGSSADAKGQQEEVFRILQTQYVFLATPDHGVGWPEDLFTDRPAPSNLRTPPSSQFFSPETFSSGDSLSMPPGEVRVGDSWTSPIRGGLGVARYRVQGRASRLGHDCWQIEGTTSYTPRTSRLDIVNYTVGPRTSTHFFDAEIGRLVLSEEVTPMKLVFADGRVVETTIRVKRQLEQPSSEAVNLEVSRELADGETRKFVYRDGSPLNMRNDWLRVIQSGLMNPATIFADGSREEHSLRWSIVLDFSGRNIRSVKLFDVTQAPTRPLEFETLEDTIQHTPCVLLFDQAKFGSPEANWFAQDVFTEKIIKVVVEEKSGETRTLYQPILIHTQLFRADRELHQRGDVK